MKKKVVKENNVAAIAFVLASVVIILTCLGVLVSGMITVLIMVFSTVDITVPKPPPEVWEPPPNPNTNGYTPPFIVPDEDKGIPIFQSILEDPHYQQEMEVMESNTISYAPGNDDAHEHPSIYFKLGTVIPEDDEDTK